MKPQALSPGVYAQLAALPLLASGQTRAARVTLRDGRALERVLFIPAPTPYAGTDPVVAELDAGLREALDLDLDAIVRQAITDAGLEDQVDIDAVKDEARRDPTELPVEDIATIAPCPHCLPAWVCRRVVAGGETVMGTYMFELTLRDGRHLICVANQEIALVALPEGVSADAITDTRPLGRNVTRVDCADDRHRTCYYSAPAAT